MTYTTHHGNNLEILRTLADNSIDAIVTDPPYGLGKEPDALAMLRDWMTGDHHEVKGKGFMGKEWDAFVPQPALWKECLRVLKPGGHLLAFAGTRTQDLMALGLRIAGFEIRDMAAWLYGSGFPKSLDVSKAIDKAAGAEREVVGSNPNHRAVSGVGYEGVYQGGNTGAAVITAPATDAARQWQGWGTALKPALEPITVARKPLAGTVAENVLAHGTGALNIDGCRVEGEAREICNYLSQGAQGCITHTGVAGHSGREYSKRLETAGRWPANVLHDGSEEVVRLFPETKSGVMKAGTQRAAQTGPGSVCYGTYGGAATDRDTFGDSGSAARFFYCAKASKKDRDGGLDSIRTVKHITGLCKSENMELAELLQRVTSESIVKWGIDESGESITGLCLSDSLSTILTEISKITTSQICNLWTLSRTNESTAAVNCAGTNGGNRAENVEKSNLSPPNTTSESQAESAHGAKSVVSKMLSEISDGENWKKGSNFHATVKPTDLMRYLCRLVTPPSGVVLDPFMGSGSTGKAAMLEGFRFIGIEREAEYVEIANARIKAAYDAAVDSIL